MSRQDILDDPAVACPRLHQFLGAYFHQDWTLEGHDWETVVDDFIVESPRAVVTATAEELRDLVAAGFSDAELGAVLEGLGASVLPSALGMTPSLWLAALLQRLGAGG